MTNEIYIGECPSEEACTPAGRNPSREIQECKAYRNQIRRLLGLEPEGARLRVRHCYTGGGYHTLVCEYDPDDRVAVEYAYACEARSPQYWDLFARVELTAGLIPIPGDGAWINDYKERA